MVSGMAVLVIGAILPKIIAEADISFAQAGALLSMMAIGNLLASLFFPTIQMLLGRWAIVIMSSFVPLCFLIMISLPSIHIFYLIMILLGIARGSITIINNSVVNKISNNSSKMLNLLHCSFAVGAFLAPFLTALFFYMGLGWRHILYILIGLCTTSVVSYAFMPADTKQAVDHAKTNSSSIKNKPLFLKSFDFFMIALLLFFYLGIENCINGWFVTYLQNTGVMSDTYATTMVSVTWLVIMIGRIIYASLAKYYKKSTLILINALGSSICFFLLVSSHQLLFITIALVGLGFFLSGIYPTSIAYAGQFIQGSSFGMAIITAIASLGGIITPQLVGTIADQKGILVSISMLIVNILIMLMLSIITYRRDRKHRIVTQTA